MDARLVEVELGEGKVSLVVARAKCVAGDCFLAAYSWRGRPRLVLAPSQPSPFCVLARLEEEERRVVEEAVYRAFRVRLPYRLPMCRPASQLVEGAGLAEVIERLKSLGVLAE